MNNNPICFTYGDPGSINSEILSESINLFYGKNKDAILIGSEKSFKNSYNQRKDKILIKFFSLNSDFIFNNTKKIKNNLNSFIKENFKSKRSIIKFAHETSIQIKKIYDENLLTKKGNENFILFFDPLPGFGFEYGKIDLGNGFLSFIYLLIGLIFVELLQFKSSLITLPVNKKSISLFFPEFTGHTDFLINRYNTQNARMLMHSDNISILMETNHIPILKLKKHLNKNHFYHTLLIAREAIKKLYLDPYIYILGLNPHKSDDSLIGNDEEKWIIPQISKFTNEFSDVKVEGPFSSDSCFTKRSFENRRHGLYIAWYHDQGLIPYKILSEGRGSNITLGLPFLRISPDHGTGFDIVGKNIADSASLEFCIKTALEMEGKWD